MEKITKEFFNENIANLSNKEWLFLGEKPAIIKFGAEWCNPCKMIDPILEEVSKEYTDKIHIYKIDVDEEQELAGLFGIQSVPSILFVPLKEQPQMALGVLPKDVIKKAINDLFKI